jgi:hypothetical protein
MPLNGLLNPLRLNTDVPLGGGGAAVLQESLDKADFSTGCGDGKILPRQRTP